MNAERPLTEAELRELRDQCFDQECTGHGWLACRENWVKPENIHWLQQHQFSTEQTAKHKP